MPLYFITGNANKFKDAKSVLRNIVQLDIDLAEIQELDAKKIIRSKLLEAFKHHKGEFIVDDVSLRIEGMNGLPGPLIKWFIESIGLAGIASLAEKIGKTEATVSTIMGYAKSPDEIYFFEGSAKGKIVQPRGVGGFGWDIIFQPEGSNLTFSEIKAINNNQPNVMRMEALNKLKEFLDK